MFWVISVYFSIRNTLPKSGTFLLGHPVYIYSPTIKRKKKLNIHFDFTVKGKAVPLQARKSPEGSRKLRFPDFMTTAQDGGKVVSLTHRPPLPPGNTPGTNFC